MFSLVKESWDNHGIRVITIVFGCLCIPFPVLACVFSFMYASEMDDDEDVTFVLFFGGVVGAVLGLLLLMLFYSDWILGAIAGNLAGAPSSDIAVLYWLYFATKRLPLATL